MRFGKREHREVHALAGFHRTDVRFTDGEVDFHLAQVLGDREERRGLEAGGHRGTDRHVTRDHGAVNGRLDHAVREVGLRRLHVGGLNADRGTAGLRRIGAAGGGDVRRCDRVVLRCGLSDARLRLRRTGGRFTARLLCGGLGSLHGALRRDEIGLIVIDRGLRDVALREQAVVAGHGQLRDLQRALRFGHAGIGTRDRLLARERRGLRGAGGGGCGLRPRRSPYRYRSLPRWRCFAPRRLALAIARVGPEPNRAAPAARSGRDALRLGLFSPWSCSRRRLRSRYRKLAYRRRSYFAGSRYRSPRQSARDPVGRRGSFHTQLSRTNAPGDEHAGDDEGNDEDDGGDRSPRPLRPALGVQKNGLNAAAGVPVG